MITKSQTTYYLYQALDLFIQFTLGLLLELFPLLLLLLLILLLDLLEPLLCHLFAEPVHLAKSEFQLVCLLLHQIDNDGLLLPACLGFPWIYEPDGPIINYSCAEIGREEVVDSLWIREALEILYLSDGFGANELDMSLLGAAVLHLNI